MSTVASTGTVRGSEHQAVRELIADTLSVWFGSREPDSDTSETISARSLDEMLCRIADRAFSAGRSNSLSADLDGRLCSASVHLNGISAAFTLLVDHARLSDAIMSPDLLVAFEVMMGGVVAEVKAALTEAHLLLQGRAP